jgi:glutathione peroxidase-family protein
MAKIDVKGSRAAPLYQTLIAASENTANIRWNFSKFVIDGEGSVTRFGSRDEPEDLLA